MPKLTNEELQLILQEGEGYKIEFKENSSGLDREIVAFANASGGRIFMGVADNGNIKGVKISNQLRSQVQDIANNCRPKVKVLLDYPQNYPENFNSNQRESESNKEGVSFKNRN